jgi:hypothetical protein
MTDLPEITAQINITRTNIDNGVQYTFDVVGGDVIGVTLEYIQNSLNDLVHISGDYLIIGNLGFMILGYKSPGILVCRLSDIGGA